MRFYSEIIISIAFCTSICNAQTSSNYTKGKDDFFTGNYTVCLKKLLKVEANAPEKDVNYFIGLSYYNIHKYDSAIIFLEKDLIQNTSNYNPYIKKAQSEKNLKQYVNATKDLDKLIVINNNYFLAYYEKGEIAYEQKAYSDAIVFYKKALDIKPHFENSYHKIGFCYLNLKDTLKACESWKNIEDLDDFEGYQKIETICKPKTQ